MLPVIELYYLPIHTDGFDIDLDGATEVLDEKENERYLAYKSEFAQASFLQARRMIKTILAKKSNCYPSDITFAYSSTEKPYLKDNPKYHFNISHTQSTIVIAIAEVPVGVDVEDIERCKKVWPKADTFLNSHVKNSVDLGQNDEQCAAIFAEHWSCTESYIRLKGSTMYREKNRVKIKFYSEFPKGKRYFFEDTCFTLFTLSSVARISIATNKIFPDVNVIHWRSGEQIMHPVHVEKSKVNAGVI